MTSLDSQSRPLRSITQWDIDQAQQEVEAARAEFQAAYRQMMGCEHELNKKRQQVQELRKRLLGQLREQEQ